MTARPLTPEMLAERWQCSDRHVRNLIRRGELPAFRLGGKLLRIRPEDVEEYECRNGASSNTEGSGQPSADTATPERDIRSELMIERLRSRS